MSASVVRIVVEFSEMRREDRGGCLDWKREKMEVVVEGGGGGVE